LGHLAALLNLGMAPKNEHPLAGGEGVHTRLVAGACNRSYLHLDFASILDFRFPNANTHTLLCAP